MKTSPSRAGFTLVELLMVVAIIAVIATLAVQKLSGIQTGSKARINQANVVRIAGALETHVLANPGNVRFDKLDALTRYGAPKGTPGDTSALGDVDALMVYTNELVNTGLARELRDASLCNPYSISVPLLGTYYLQDSEVEVLRRDLGMRHVMRGTDGGRFTVGDDNAWVSASADDPDACASISTALTNGLAVAVVNPAFTNGDVPVGPAVYKACGSDVFFTMAGRTVSLSVGGVACADNEAAFNALRAGDGILLAFGLGENCALVGSNLGGLDTAPLSPAMNAGEYRRYLVLVRVKYAKNGSSYTATSAEFAGVLDPRGRPASLLRE